MAVCVVLGNTFGSSVFLTKEQSVSVRIDRTPRVNNTASTVNKPYSKKARWTLKSTRRKLTLALFCGCFEREKQQLVPKRNHNIAHAKAVDA
jgi:hypothetical protein